MADAKQHPHEKHQFTDHEKNVLTQLRPMMGGLSDEDKEVEEHLQLIGEANAAKMKAAQTGGAGLGPPPADVRAAQQQDALAQQAAAQGAVQAAQAQGAQRASQTPSGPPPAVPTKMQAAPEAPPAPGPQEGPPEPEEGPPQ